MDGDEETLRLPKETGAQSGRSRLLVFFDDRAQPHLLPERGAVTVGRGEGVDLRLDDQAISRRHLTLHVGDTVQLEDLGSANGTRVRGRELDRGETVELKPGDSVEIGRTLLVLQRAASSQARRVQIHSHDDFATRVEEECGRANRAKSQFAVLRLSAPGVDFVAAVERLAREIQPGDVLGEYGPGEFEVLLVDCDEALGDARARGLASSASAGAVPALVGVANFPRDGRTSATLLERANAAVRGAEPQRDTVAPVLVREGAMDRLHRTVERVAASTITVLITGETGVGKGVLALELHQRSPRAAQPFLALNCAELAESLLEAELFGHEPGAFTGAGKKAKAGLIEAADTGTLFLDEIGEMPLSVQAKLLRVLEDHQIRPVMSVKSRPVDIRIIAATNRDLEVAVETKMFRRDLYFRLAGISLNVPPLRERAEEIEALARVFLEQAGRQSGKAPPELSAEAVAALQRYSWPGNVRELRNAIERAVVLCAERAITPELLPAEKPQRTLYAEVRPPRDERERIQEALLRCGGNQGRAAKLLGLSRRTLVTRLAKYRLPRPRDRS